MGGELWDVRRPLRNGQGRNAVRLLTRDGERLSARGDNSHARASLQERIRGSGGFGDNVLAVIDEKKDRSPPEVVGDRIDQGTAGLFAQPQRRSDSLRNERT